MTTYVVSSGRVSSGLVIHAGDYEYILAGGFSSRVVVASGGNLVVSSGGSSVSATISNGGSATVQSGGNGSATIVSSGGVETVTGTEAGSIINSGGTQAVSGSGLAVGTVVSSGGKLLVSDGIVSSLGSSGSARSTTLNGGVEIVYQGGATTDLVINSGGLLQLGPGTYFGGKATNIVINSGGSATLGFFGDLNGAIVLSGGLLENLDGHAGGVVLSGGTERVGGDVNAIDSGTVILAGGVQSVTGYGGRTSGTIVNSGGLQLVGFNEDTAFKTVVNSGGLQTVDGGTTGGTVVNGGGSQTVSLDGRTLSTTLYSGAYESVSSGGVASGTAVYAGGLEIISSGGLASGTIVYAGGLEIISSGGVASGTFVYAGGVESILSGGIAVGTTVYGGTQSVASGNVTSGTAVLGGGLQNVAAGGIASGTIVYSGGVQSVAAGGVADGTTIQFGVSEVVSAGATVSGAIIEAGGRLVISAGGITANTHLKLGGTIDLPNLAYVSGATASVTSQSAASYLLTIHDGGQTQTLQLGNTPPGTLKLSNDGHGGTAITTSGSLTGNITLNPGQTSLSSTTSAAIVLALKQALDNWGEYILSRRPLNIHLNIGATRYPTEVADDVTPLVPLPAGLKLDVGRQLPLPTITQAEAAIAAGYSFSSPDITITLNPAYLSAIYFASDPSSAYTVPSNKLDGVSLFEHEIGHAIGFDGQRLQQSGVLEDAETIFDTWTNVSSGSATLVSPAAEGPYGGQPVPLTSGASNGSNFYTLASTSGSVLSNDLMAPGISPGQRYQISAIDLAAVKTAGVPAGLDYYSPTGVNQIYVPVQFAAGPATFTVTPPPPTTPNADDNVAWQIPGIRNLANHTAYQVQREIWLTTSPYAQSPTGFLFYSEIEPSVDAAANSTGKAAGLSGNGPHLLPAANNTTFYVTYVLAEQDNAGRYVQVQALPGGTVTFTSPDSAGLTDYKPSNPDEGNGSDNGQTAGGDGNGGDTASGGIEFDTAPANASGPAPTISGTVAFQTTASEAMINPFAHAVITDANSGAIDTLTILLAGSGGTLTGTGLSGGNGTYSLMGSAAVITTELEALTFLPTAGAAGTASTTTFTLTDISTAGASAAIDSVTSVTNYDLSTASLPIYRFFDQNLGTHLFTQNLSEAKQILATRSDLTEETNTFGAVSALGPAAEPVYRFFETGNGTHFFTSNNAEFLGLTTPGTANYRPDLSYEATSNFYVDSTQQSGDVAVYRLFDKVHGTQFMTGNQSEYQNLTTPGSATYRPDLSPEGIAFYAPAGVSHT